MIRVLLYTGITLFAISAALLYLPTFYCVLLAILLAVFLLILFCLHKVVRVNGLKTLVCIALAFTLLGVYLLGTKLNQAERLEGYTARIICTVVDYPTRFDTYTAYVVKTEAIVSEPGKTPLPAGVPQTLKLRLTDINNINAKVFDRMVLTVELHALGEYRSSSLANGIYGGGYVVKQNKQLGTNRPFYAVLYDLRAHLKTRLYESVSYEEATFVNALLLGDRNDLSPALTRNAKITGVSHILVVSGMHLGILFQALTYLALFLRLPRRMSALLQILATFAMMAICGFTPSIMRAGLTYFIVALGRFFYIKPDALNSLGTAAVILLFANPFGFGNIAMLLSFASTFGLLVLCPAMYEKALRMSKKPNKVPRPVKALLFAVCQTLAATLTTFPICMVVFGYISIIAPLVNVLIGYAATLILLLSAVVLILLCLPAVFRSAAAVPIVLLCLLTRYVVFVINRFAAVDWAVLPAERWYLLCWVLLVAAVVCLIVQMARQRKKDTVQQWLRATAAICTVLCIGSFVLLRCILPANHIVVLNVKKGYCMMVQHRGSLTVIGAGDQMADTASIQNQMIRLGENEVDYLILPELNRAFAGGAPNLIAEARVAHVLYPQTGAYYPTINHIADARFTPYNAYTEITDKAHDVYVQGMADVGCVVRAGSHTLLVYTGNGVWNNRLQQIASGENTVLVCTGTLPDEITKIPAVQLVLCGEQDALDPLIKRAAELGLSNVRTVESMVQITY